jgi:hypothetical protein
MNYEFSGQRLGTWRRVQGTLCWEKRQERTLASWRREKRGFKIQDSKFKIRDWRFKMQNHPIANHQSQMARSPDRPMIRSPDDSMAR